MMHPEFSQMAIHQNQRDLDRRVQGAYLEHTLPELHTEPSEAVALRLCRVADDPTLERLAILEGRPAPAGRFVVAEVGGEVVAAVSLNSGSVLADPFRATAHLVPLLELRASQLAPDVRRSRGLPLWGAVRSFGRA
jgi:hypothetical protein